MENPSGAQFGIIKRLYDRRIFNDQPGLLTPQSRSADNWTRETSARHRLPRMERNNPNCLDLAKCLPALNRLICLFAGRARRGP